MGRTSAGEAALIAVLAALGPTPARAGGEAHAAAAEAATAQKAPVEHERLRFRNEFKTPEEVVGYYCGRDASGFVWSGLLDVERRAFTTWARAPEHDSFYVATRYEILAPKGVNVGMEADVQVRYDVKAIGDAHGTRQPAAQAERLVTFHLKRVEGRWKIVSPPPEELPPVVVEAKFPY